MGEPGRDDPGTGGIFRGLKVIKRLFSGRFLLIIVLLALGYYIYDNIDEILDYRFEFEWIPLLGSASAVTAGYVIMFMTWRMLARSFGLEAPLIASAKAFYLSQLGKYVPGKIGLVLVRVNAYRGYPPGKVVLATAVEYAASFVSACIMILGSAVLTGIDLPPWLRWSAMIMPAALLAFLWPPFLKRIVNAVSRLAKRQPVGRVPSFPRMLLFVSMYMMVGLCWGLGLFLALNSLSPVDVRYYFAVTGSFWSAVLIGIAAVFAPSGIGVREGVLMLVLPAFVSRPTVMVGAILMRLVMTAVELFLAGFFSLIHGKPWKR